MKILPPHKITSEILDVICESKKHLVIVSPYVNFNKWERMESELKNAISRGVQIYFFVRYEPENAKSWEQVKELGIKPILIKNLHAKFYYNEYSGVISSMNLLTSSNNSAIEIGTKVEGKEEIEELKKFVSSYIITNKIDELPSEEDVYVSKEKFSILLSNVLSNNFRRNVSVYFKKGELNINTGRDSFFCSVDKGANKLHVSGILSQDEADSFQNLRAKYFTSGYFFYEQNTPNKGFYNMLSAITKERLSTDYLDGLRLKEKKQLLNEIAMFILTVSDFKQEVYQLSKTN